MIPYRTTTRHDPERGEYGDCLRACLASVLNAPSIHDVPHFAAGNPPADQLWQSVRNWLMDEHNLSVWFTPYAADRWQDVAETCNALNPGMFYLLQGKSAGGDHVVVCKGDRIIHDPSPAGGGLVGPGSNGVFMVVLLISDRLVP